MMARSGARIASSKIQLGTQTFVYLGHNDHPNATRLAEVAGGIIVAGACGRRRLRALRDSGYTGPALYDLVEYKEPKGGTPRLLSTASVDIDAQVRLGVSALLTPSPRIRGGDIEGLEQVLREAEQFAETAERMGHNMPVFCTFAVDQSWLTRHADALVTRMARFPLPVAFVPSANYDLFGSRKAVEGFLRVQEVVIDSMMLRTDLSGIGALAYGSLATGIGTSTDTRHNWIPFKRRKGATPKGDNDPDAVAYVLIERLLSFRSGTDLARLHDDPVLNCEEAEVCRGGSAGPLALPASRPEADVHNVAVWRRIADRVTQPELERRPAAWRAEIASAEAEFSAVMLRGRQLDKPKFFSAWE